MRAGCTSRRAMRRMVVRPFVLAGPFVGGARPGSRMTLDDAVALTFVDNLPRIGLTARLQADDPELVELAASITADARKVLADAASRQIDAIAWNDARFPAALLAIPDCPPALWYRGALDLFQRPAVAIVGSRAASAASLEVASQI